MAFIKWATILLAGGNIVLAVLMIGSGNGDVAPGLFMNAGIWALLGWGLYSLVRSWKRRAADEANKTA